MDAPWPELHEFTYVEICRGRLEKMRTSKNKGNCPSSKVPLHRTDQKKKIQKQRLYVSTNVTVIKYIFKNNKQ